MNVSSEGRVGLEDDEPSALANSGFVGVWGGVRIVFASLWADGGGFVGSMCVWMLWLRDVIYVLSMRNVGYI